MIDHFASAAREYCEWVESGISPSSILHAREWLRLTVRLYEAALLLPDSLPSGDDVATRLDEQAWKRVRAHLSNNLAQDYYWEVFDPLEAEPPEAAAGMLSDDLADIWLDVKTGLQLLDLGTEAAAVEAAGAWRHSFETHWGRHAASAIRALHALCFGAIQRTVSG